MDLKCFFGDGVLKMNEGALIKGLPPHAFALGAFLLFVANSYPMMYPGYDIWWHLDVIRSVAYFDGQSYGRWHWVWNRILGALNIDDLFVQALFIHRAQFTISLLSLYVSALLIISAALRGRQLKPFVSACLGAIAVIYWMLMHGTSSRAPYLEEFSAVTMSWINWYSVSHQIALPLYVLAISLVIHAFSSRGLHPWVRFFELMGSLLLVLFVGLLHAAEVPYFLFMAGFGVILYSDRKRLFLISIGSVFSLFALAFVFGKLSHGDSLLLSRILSGDWLKILADTQYFGNAMVGGVNRASTSWHVMYTFPLMLLIVLIVLMLFPCRRFDVLEARVVLWLMASAALPASVLFKYTAGLLAQITYLDLAWRFSFGSLLFVVPSIYLGFALVILEKADPRRSWSGQIVISIFIALMALLFCGNTGPVRDNYVSLAASTSAKEMHFGLSDAEISRLQFLSKMANNGMFTSKACFDVFTSHYLFYIFDVNDICLPRRIAEGPTYLLFAASVSPGEAHRVERCTCDFSRKDVPAAFHDMVPTWNFRLLK